MDGSAGRAVARLALPVLVTACSSTGAEGIVEAAAEVGSRTGHAGTVLGGHLFLLGGIETNGGAPARRPARLDLETGRWTELDPQPTFRWFAAACTIGDAILMMGGGADDSPFLDVVEVFDPVQDEWRSSAPLACARNRFAAVERRGRAYAIGGYTADGNTGSVEVYDPVAGVWSPGPPLLHPRHGHAAVVQDGHIVVSGGYVDAGEAQEQTATVEVLAPGADEWVLGEPLPEPRGFHGAVVLGGEAFVFQGRASDPEPTLSARLPGAVFSSAGPAPPHLRHRYVAIAHAGRAWLVGGEGEAEEEVVVQAFTPGRGWSLPFARR